MAEIVYVLTNEAMEGLVKISKTNNGIEKRIKELDNTSVPLPFQCFYAAEVSDCKLVEEKLHKIFADKRIRPNREFFRMDANQVRVALELATLKDVTPQIDIVVDATDIQALQRAVVTEERRSRLRFTELGIPAGAALTFTKDKQVTCLVVADGRVEYRGELLSPSGAALKAIRNLGYDWSTVNGYDFWEYEGETLVARRLRLEDEQI